MWARIGSSIIVSFEKFITDIFKYPGSLTEMLNVAIFNPAKTLLFIFGVAVVYDLLTKGVGIGVIIFMTTQFGIILKDLAAAAEKGSWHLPAILVAIASILYQLRKVR